MSLAAVAAFAQARWQVTPEAGINMTKYKGETPVVGFKAGAAVAYTFGEGRFALQSGLYYVRRGTGNRYSATLFGHWTNPQGERVDFGTTVSEAYMYPSSFYYGYGYGTGEYGGGWGYSSSYDFLPENLTIDRIHYNRSSSRMDYIQLPLLARLNGQMLEDVRFHLAFGPYLAWGVGGRTRYEEVNRTAGVDLPYHKRMAWNPFRREEVRVGYPRKRFDWGLSAEAGLDIRRVTLKMGYDLGMGEYLGGFSLSPKYHTVSLSAGYSF